MTTNNNEYSSFNLNGEKIILLPGSRFSKNEIKYRLKEMDVKDNNSQDKEYLAKLYDASLNDYNNCLKIIQRLKKDTNNMDLKLTMSQRPSLPSNLKNSNNLAQNKMINISYDVKNYHPNSREQQINIIKPVHTNRGKYVQNPFISSISGQYFNNSYNNEINNKINSYNNNVNSFNLKNVDNSNNMNINSGMNANFGLNMVNKEDKLNDKNNNYLSNTYEYNLEKNNISNINKINNNSSFLSDNNLFKNRGSNANEEINIDLNNQATNNNYNIYKSQNPEEKIDIEKNDKIDLLNNSNNSQNNLNYNNQSKNERLDITPNENNIKKHSKRLTYQPNELKNDIYQNNNRNRKSFTNKPYSININEIPYNSVIQGMQKNPSNVADNLNSSNKEEENICNNKIEINKDSDEVSTFSFFSAFDNFKKYPLYKNYKFILIHLLILLAILGVCFSLFNILKNSWDSIISFFSNTLEFLSDPKGILDIITSYIGSIIICPINYWHITFPLIFLIFVVYFFIRKYWFKKRCNEILEKIVKDLRENGNENRSVSEEDICKRYSQMYGISYNRFWKKYLPQIRKLRRNDNRLKLSQVNNNDKEYVFWELNE